MNYCSLLTSGWKAVLDFVYPSLCLHCGELGPTLCLACSEQLALLDHDGGPHAAAFLHMGPAVSLLHAFSKHPHLDHALAGFLVAQLHQLQWPLPDVIVPMPQKPAHWIRRAFHPPTVLAKALGETINRPIHYALKRPLGADFLDELSPFEWNRRVDLSDKTALLIGDSSHTGESIKEATKALQEARPVSIYTMTLTRYEG